MELKKTNDFIIIIIIIIIICIYSTIYSCFYFRALNYTCQCLMIND